MSDDDLISRYRDEGYDESRLHPDPLDTFREWFSDAERVGCAQHEAMALATVDDDGTPGVRNLLVRTVDERGLVFYTNERSRKGRALFHDGRCEALFSWLAVDRQVRINGRAGPISPADSDAYFASRPRLSQLGAHASRQSEPLPAREELEQRIADLDARYEGRDVPRPQHWGGFRIVPKSWEFWQGRSARLHDRYRYLRDPLAGWIVTRLNP